MIASHVFEKVCGINQPHPHQEETLDACFYRADFPLLLSAPCGTGKTEAAVAPFLAQFLEGDFRIAPRLIYVLPTRALCNQLGQRLRCYAKRMDPLIRVEVHHGGHLEDAFFMADIVVTTLDQFVYGYARTTSLVGGHLEAPAGSIANSVVVLDEAHMYQSPYTFGIVRAMLGILNAARVPVVMMTATMPPALLADFEEEFTRTGEPLAKVEGTDVRQRSLHVTPEPAALVTDGGLHPLAMERLRSATRALVVLNQVKRAQAAFRALREAGIEATLVHARFTAADRRRLESRIAAALGRNDRAGGVVVSTQVCEAGLDISADLLLTELAPADSLVQRMGRCARWEGEGKGEVVVFGLDALLPDEAEAEGAKPWMPYDRQHLEHAADYLRQHPSAEYGVWDTTKDFVAGLDYHADDVVAADSLADLYEATLYAAERPRDLSVREGKYLHGWVGSKDEWEALQSDREAYKKRLMTLDYGVARSLANKGLFLGKDKGRRPYRVQRNREKKRLELTDEAQVLPMQTYLINPEHYSSQEGVVEPDAGLVGEDE